MTLDTSGNRHKGNEVVEMDITGLAKLSTLGLGHPQLTHFPWGNAPRKAAKARPGPSRKPLGMAIDSEAFLAFEAP